MKAAAVSSVLPFARERELAEIEGYLHRRGSFLLHGEAGAGKTLLLTQFTSRPDVLYSPNSRSPQEMFRNLAGDLLVKDNVLLRQKFAGNANSISAASLKGIVLAALQAAEYTVFLDHLARPSQVFAAAIKQVSIKARTPIGAAARSAHMEDIGFLGSMFADKAERIQLSNFSPQTAAGFARDLAARLALNAANLAEALERIVEFSGGNPGAITRMLEMSRLPRYRSGENIKITPLYLDFRMNCDAGRSS